MQPINVNNSAGFLHDQLPIKKRKLNPIFYYNLDYSLSSKNAELIDSSKQTPSITVIGEVASNQICMGQQNETDYSRKITKAKKTTTTKEVDGIRMRWCKEHYKYCKEEDFGSLNKRKFKGSCKESLAIAAAKQARRKAIRLANEWNSDGTDSSKKTTSTINERVADEFKNTHDKKASETTPNSNLSPNLKGRPKQKITEVKAKPARFIEESRKIIIEDGVTKLDCSGHNRFCNEKDFNHWKKTGAVMKSCQLYQKTNLEIVKRIKAEKLVGAPQNEVPDSTKETVTIIRVQRADM